LQTECTQVGRIIHLEGLVSGVKMGLSGAAIIVEAMNSLLSTFHGGWNLAQVQDTLSSQESSADVVQEALGVGALGWLGYIVKQGAGDELLAALDAFFLGEEFVNRSSAGFGATTARTCGGPESQSLQGTKSTIEVP